jgi:DNA topoisomerase-3
VGLTAVIAEKPSVARDLAAHLGATKRGEGYLHGDGVVVTWAIGHLVGLAQPHEINPAWKSWRRELLPMLPQQFPLVVQEETKDQFDVVRRILTSAKVSEVVCATDAGREGELIFRYIYEATGCRLPVKRLWLSSLTPEAIRKAFQALRAGSDYDGLAAAARGRSQADWLVGMNLSRAYTLQQGDTLSVGRVQTPTLALLVERERTIRDFVPEEYLEVKATFTPGPLPAAGASGSTQRVPASYVGTWFRPKPQGGRPGRDERKLPKDGVEAGAIVARVERAGAGVLESVTHEQRKMAAPLLYDLTELQRHANRLFGFPASRTLEIAQRLYEQHKLLSYPRTDSRHLSAEAATTLGPVVDAIAPRYPGLVAPGSGQRPLGPRYVDDAKVTDHHALLPTARDASGVSLDGDEQKLYDLVCRRVLQAWHGDHVWATTTVITAVQTPPHDSATAVIDRFFTQGSAVLQPGWKVLDVPSRRDRARAKPAAPVEKDKDGEDLDDEPQDLPPGLAQGERAAASGAKADLKVTRPPKRLTDASLLTAMETAGQTLDDRELSEAMRERGLGTPATRAAMIETLLTRGYAARDGRQLVATPKGFDLIERVHPDVKSPAMTGAWEHELRRVEKGEAPLGEFLHGIEEYVRDVVGRVLAGPLAPRMPYAGAAPGAARSSAPGMVATTTNGAGPQGAGGFAHGSSSAAGTMGAAANGARPAASAQSRPATPSAASPPNRLAAPAASPAPVRPQGPTGSARAPVGAEGLGALLQSAFGHSKFRPHQEEVCRAVTNGQDSLLVMPTGAGKSLCYQLPGLARGGTCVVVSPLIALMDDQVSKLQALGLRAERIHSGRDRGEARQVVNDYLNGQLDYLYIAPERLAVPGFTETLARRTPSLVAIDEAHCISHWGHDFRPEYRRLGERLPLLRPAPVVALTATATPQVQDDIAVQLGLRKVRRFIHGFRRTNLAIEATEVPKPERPDVVRALLRDPSRRPAILYAPSRKDAEALAQTLSADFSCAAYHAGLPAATRDRVQTAFLSSKLEVVVATIAFGMGVDKADVRTVIHLALPRTLEGYYQEIGRAGRDGKPSRAILLHSFVDRKTNEFLRERSYPDPELLAQIAAKLSDAGEPREALAARMRRMDPEVFERALEKLWIHGGADITPDDTVRAGHDHWRPSYEAQLQHQKEQEEQVQKFAQGHGCRMLSLIRHFGDEEDGGERCGVCDSCDPSACVAQHFREATDAEFEGLETVVERLREGGEQAAGALYRNSGLEGTLDRRGFELVVSGLVRAGLVSARDDQFEKGGQKITFQRLSLTGRGRVATHEQLEEVQLPAPPEGSGGKGKKRRKRERAKAVPQTRAAPGATGGGRFPPGHVAGAGEAVRRRRPAAEEAPPDSRLVEALKAWRLSEAKRKRVPAFRILTDKTLYGLASARPRDEDGLLEVPGIGPKLVEKYGTVLLAMIR